MTLFEEKEAKPVYSRFVTIAIDADSLIYRAAHAGEKEFNATILPEDHPLFKEQVLLSMHEQQVEIFNSMIAGIVFGMTEDLNKQGIDVETIQLVYTPKKDYCDANDLKLNFRYEVVNEFNEAMRIEHVNGDQPAVQVPGYKSSRKGMTLPKGIPELFTYALNDERAIASNHCEADDVVAWAKTINPNGIVIACLDKDIYSGVAGTHYNYNRREWITTTEDEAKLFVHRQCLMGDNSDGIKGIHRYGIKTAEADLPKWTNDEEMWDTVVDIHMARGYTEEYAIMTMRLVNLHQLDLDGAVNLWTPYWQL